MLRSESCLHDDVLREIYPSIISRGVGHLIKKLISPKAAFIRDIVSLENILYGHLKDSATRTQIEFGNPRSKGMPFIQILSETIHVSK